MAESEKSSDLGALLGRLSRAVASAEEPILQSRGLTMWEYIVLSALAEAPAVSQTELARETNRDPTRLIGHLDALGARGLVVRDADGGDRRRRLVRLTQQGSALLESARDDVAAMEAALLPTDIGADLRRSLEAAVAALPTS